MPAAKLRPVGTEHDGAAAGHVLATVVAHALDDGRGPGVADAEPLPHVAAEEHLAGRGAVADHVARDDLLAGVEGGRPVGPDDDPAAGETLGDVVVGVALEPQRDARGAGTRRTTARPNR